ncbi:hypothetical protein JAAARDRAFT_212403 [Jaapia argillacea MUCL 33604]|uniref:Rho-GAP domain-containing protein n=1 Tax=Jaapia argillacea MUCL 33604 TaxID=933084 RepID=A0A067QMP2_9AGAM|nr:hypothetical protein JAAARDRAFT_212403 [Jaapia argillacea MUCL 33604]
MNRLSSVSAIRPSILTLSLSSFVLKPRRLPIAIYTRVDFIPDMPQLYTTRFSLAEDVPGSDRKRPRPRPQSLTLRPPHRSTKIREQLQPPDVFSRDGGHPASSPTSLSRGSLDELSQFSFPPERRGSSALRNETRGRFVSMPVMHSQWDKPGSVEIETDRMDRACGQAPLLNRSPAHIKDLQAPPVSASYRRRQTAQLDSRGHACSSVAKTPSPPVVSRGLSRSSLNPPPRLQRPDFPRLLGQLDALVRLSGASEHKDFVDVTTVATARMMREREKHRVERMDDDVDHRAFGVSLRDLSPGAWTSTILGGFEQDLPFVVFSCVEELYRTGIYQPHLFRALPNRSRHIQLLEQFDSSPLFGDGFTLQAERMPDICALLTTYLSSLPSPLIDDETFEGFWSWCVRPSLRREEEKWAEAEGDEGDGKHGDRRADGSYRSGFEFHDDSPLQILSRLTTRSHSLQRHNASLDGPDNVEAAQINIARIILQLLPTEHFSLLVYLLSFFTQIPLCPENGVLEEDIGRIFGFKLLGGGVGSSGVRGDVPYGGADREKAKWRGEMAMVWLLTRWHWVSDGLFTYNHGGNEGKTIAPDISAGQFVYVSSVGDGPHSTPTPTRSSFPFFQTSSSLPALLDTTFDPSLGSTSRPLVKSQDDEGPV